MDERPTREEVLLMHAAIAALRGTCSRAQVGVVIARNSRILVTGYNGAPKHMPHCDHSCDCGFESVMAHGFKVEHDPQCRSKLPCEVAVHAEANAIAYAARYGIELRGSAMYCTHMPCLKCAQLIVNCGIRNVVYLNQYRDESGVILLRGAGITVDTVE